MQEELYKCGTSVINDKQFTDITEEEADELRSMENPEFLVHVWVKINGRIKPLPSFRMETEPMPSCPKISIPTAKLKSLGFHFNTDDNNAHYGDVRMEQNTENQLYATVYRIN